MTMHRNSIQSLVTVAVLAAASASVATAAPDQTHAKGDCFASNTWEGWSAPGDGDTLYLRIGLHDIYRVELTPGTHVRKDANSFLVNRIHGSNWICSPLDLSLTLSDGIGTR